MISKRLAIYGVGLLAAFALGWFVRYSRIANVAPIQALPKPNSVQTMATRALAELLGYYQRKDMQLTARNRSLVDSLTVYRHRGDSLAHLEHQADTVFVAAVR